MSVLHPPLEPIDHVRGAANAAVTLVEYGDFECPYCAAAHVQVKRIEERFKPKLKFAFRHFPLTQVHPLAEPAAETSEAAAVHGRFWEMHDALYENRENFGPALLLALAERLGVSESELNGALASKVYAPRIRRDFVSGVRSGVNGTPTFFINGKRHDGGYSFEDLAAAIEAAL